LSRDRENVSPSVVYIGNHTIAVGVIDVLNVALQIGNKEVAVDGSDAVRGVSVLHTDGIPRRVIEEDEQVLNTALIRPCLIQYRTARERVGVLGAVHRLARADAVAVIGIIYRQPYRGEVYQTFSNFNTEWLTTISHRTVLCPM